MSGLNFGAFLIIGLASTWLSHSIASTQRHGNWLGLTIITSSAALLWNAGPNSLAFGAFLGSGWALLNVFSEALLTR